MGAIDVIIVSAAVMFGAQSSPASTGNTTPPATTKPTIHATTQPHAHDGSRPAPGGLLSPLPETGDVPPIVGMLDATPGDELRQRAELRGYAKQIRQLRHKYFGDIKVEKIR